MSRLRDAIETLDHSLVWVIGQIICLAVFLAVLVSYYFLVAPPHADVPLVRNEVSFGCYVAPGQDPILLSAAGLTIQSQNVGPVGYVVQAGTGGRRSYLELAEPLKLEVVDDRIVFSRGEDRGTWRAALTSRVGGVYAPQLNDEPIAYLEFQGPNGSVEYRRQAVIDCTQESTGP